MATEIKYDVAVPLRRPAVPYSTLPELSGQFLIDPTKRSYKHQYSNIYFVRLVELRPHVEAHAEKKWSGMRGRPQLLHRILSLQRGQLCYIVGTVYMDMPLKPNVLEDMARSNWIAPPAPRAKFYSAQDSVHLEDESGRVRLIGEAIRRERDRAGRGLVTGVVMAALGYETGNGDFEVVDVCFAGLPDVFKPSAGPSGSNGKAKEAMDVDEKPSLSSADGKTWVAMVSGLSVGSDTAPLDLKAEMLVEWLMGEDGVVADQLESARIARLICAGNTLAEPPKAADRMPKRFSTATNDRQNHPTKTLTRLLRDVTSSSLPVNLVPGPHDPAGALLPQQPMPKVMFGAKMNGLECNTNPTWMSIGERSFLCAGGQNIDDVFKYIPGDARLAMAARTLEWRHLAPTAPDTLWIYPFPDTDPFIVQHRPDVYVIGNQPEFATTLVGGDEPTRVVLLPPFDTTGTVALVCLETLEVKIVEFEVPQWEGDVREAA